MEDKQTTLTRLPVVVGEGMEQSLLEEELELSPVPIQVREVQAEPIGISFYPIAGRVIVEGVIRVKVYFVGVDRMIYHRQREFRFSSSVAVAGAESGMETDVHCLIPHVFFDLTAQDRMRLKIIVDLYARVCQLAELEVVAGGDKQVRIEQACLKDKREELIELETVFDCLASCISRIEDRVEEAFFTLLANRVYLEGLIVQQVYYVDQDGLERYKEWENRFDFCFEFPGAEEGMLVDYKCFLEEINTELIESGRAVRRKLALTVLMKLSSPVQLFLSNEGDTLVNLPLIVGEKTKQIFVEGETSLAFSVRKVREGRHKIIELRNYVLKDKLVVEGQVESQIFYVDLNSVEQYTLHIWSFSSILELPGAVRGMNGWAEAKVVFADFLLEQGGKLIRQRSVVELLGRVTEHTQLLVTTVH